jgi:hypothetical protein
VSLNYLKEDFKKMATPALLIQQKNLQVIPANATSLRINTFNPDGSALDVSSGYELAKFYAFPSSNASPYASKTDLSAAMVAAFDETGFTLNISASNANSIITLMKTISNNFSVSITNDDETTSSVAAVGTLTISNLNGTV